jgi:hypothetical protein
MCGSVRVGVFQHDGHALARADAYPDSAIADVAFAQFGRQGQDVAGCGGAEGMPDGDSPTVGGELVVGMVKPPS